jgi:hypothetical protein
VAQARSWDVEHIRKRELDRLETGEHSAPIGRRQGLEQAICGGGAFGR